MLALSGDHEIQDVLILVSGEAMSVFPNMHHSVLSSGFDELCSHVLKGHTVFSAM